MLKRLCYSTLRSWAPRNLQTQISGSTIHCTVLLLRPLFTSIPAMNALKKPRPPTSPYAVSGSESKANDRSTKGNGLASITTAVSTHTLGSSELGMKPVSATEQYWAARALTAETLLAAREAHQREVRSLAYSEDIKRSVRTRTSNIIISIASHCSSPHCSSLTRVA